MKIAIYHNLSSGGGKRALCEMVSRLTSKHDIDVYTLSCAEHNFCDLRPHCNRHVMFPFTPLPLTRRPFGRLNQGIRSLDLLRLKAMQRRIAAQIDSSGYDVAFVHNCQFGQSPGLLSFLQTPSVYYCQEPPRQIYEPKIDRPYDRFSHAQQLGNLVDPLPGLYRRLLAGLDRRNVRAARLVLVNSAYSRESLYRVYGLFSRVCYLGVDTEYFKPIPLGKDNLILSVGQLVPRKGFDFLIQSLARLEPGRRPALTIVSNFSVASEKRYLEQLARELDVKVAFHTMITDTELVHLYNRAKVTAYAPIMEPFGFVPLESMACGTPVVGVREGGVRETVVDHITGLLAERDPQAFAAALSALLADPAWADQLGQNGASRVRRAWTWQNSYEQLEKHLEAVTGHHPASGETRRG